VVGIYTSASSYITLSFWVKSSVAQNFYCRLETADGTNQNYPFETGSLSAFTWTKITKTIPGNANLTFNNDNGNGLELHWQMFRGTDFTDNSVSNDTWAVYASGTRTKDATSTWYTTNDASFQITGVQLEVGSVATDFEHRSFGQELALCQRYFYKMTEVNYIGNMYYASYCASNYQHPVKMRAAPTVTATSMHININPGDTSLSSISPTTTQLGLINCANSTAVIGYPLRGQITATAEL
jgi:hypothetical protein